MTAGSDLFSLTSIGKHLFISNLFANLVRKGIKTSFSLCSPSLSFFSILKVNMNDGFLGKEIKDSLVP